MPAPPDNNARRATFVTTRWSVVLRAGASGSPSAESALATLCEAYWFPIYAHVRRRGNDPEAARDLTQGFFAELIERETIARADPDRGKFRSFLLKSVDRFIQHAHRDARALKRGGGREIISLDAQEAEARLALEPVDERSPDREFDRRWALATLERARQRLRSELAGAGKADLYYALHPHLFGDLEAVPYSDIARRMSVSLIAVKSAAFRLRKRFGELLREEVAQTLADASNVTEEVRHLIAALGR